MRIVLLVTCLLPLMVGLSVAQPLRFARAKSVLALPVLIAEHNGYFADQGLDIEFITTNSGKQSLAKLLTGEAELATSGTPPLVEQFWQGEDFCAVSTVSEAENAEKIITRRSSGIKQAEDLIGKRVGVPFGTGADFGLRDYLLFNGLERSDLQLVNIRPGPLSRGLDANRLDALVLWEPLASKVKRKLGAEYLQVDTRGTMLLDYVLVADSKLASQQPEMLVKVLLALEKANVFLRDNRQQAIQLQGELLQLSLKQSKEFFDEHLYQLSLSPRLLHALERIAEMIREDSADKPDVPDFGKLFCEQALLQVAPDNYLLFKE